MSAEREKWVPRVIPAPQQQRKRKAEPDRRHAYSWAPSPLARLKAVRAELATLADVKAARSLTGPEERYRVHLVQREAELLEEIEELRRASGRVGQD